MAVVRLSGEPPHDPNQSSALLVIDYKRLTPGEAKETHPISLEIDKCKSKNAAYLSEVLALLSWSSEGYI